MCNIQFDSPIHIYAVIEVQTLERFINPKKDYRETKGFFFLAYGDNKI